MWLAVELETIARQYYLALAIGGPVLLNEAQIGETAPPSAATACRIHQPETYRHSGTAEA